MIVAKNKKKSNVYHDTHDNDGNNIVQHNGGAVYDIIRTTYNDSNEPYDNNIIILYARSKSGPRRPM